MIDEEIAEIRRYRHQISAQFDHDPRKVVAYYRTLEKEYRESGEFRFAPQRMKKTILTSLDWDFELIMYFQYLRQLYNLLFLNKLYKIMFVQTLKSLNLHFGKKINKL